MIFDYVIIGGGISGLYTHLELLRRDKTLKCILLEKADYYGGRIYQYSDKEVSFPAGAARFNKSHTRVIKLLKEFGLIDFRKDRGIGSSIEFIDSKGEFSPKFRGKTGFEYIRKVLEKAGKIGNDQILLQFSFQEYAENVLKKDEVEFLLIASGYSGQLKHMNMLDAYHLFTNGIQDDVTFYAGYYHHLVERVVQETVKLGGKMLLNSGVNSVQYNQNLGHYHINFNKQGIYSKTVIFALPQPALLKLKLLRPIHCLLQDSIGCKSLCRVYAKFKPDDVWFGNIGKTVTNNALRYIIPMSVEQGTVMISYTDDIYTEFWRKHKGNQSRLKREIVDLVKKTFEIDIAKPEQVWVFYWECGVGYWKKGTDSEKVADFVANPMRNVFICGEIYSLDQSWVEGALETSERVLRKI